MRLSPEKISTTDCYKKLLISLMAVMPSKDGIQ